MAQQFLPMVRLAGFSPRPRTAAKRETGKLPDPRRLLLVCIVAMVLLVASVGGVAIFAVEYIDRAAIAVEIERANVALETARADRVAADDRLALRLAHEHLLAGAHFSPPGTPAPHEVSVAFPGTSETVLAWSPRRLGTEVFYAVAPMRFLASGVFLAGIGFMLYRLSSLATELEARRQAAHELARRDPLTGLGNRLAFDQQLQNALANKRQSFALLYLDLDDFKRVNDSLGHGAGDELLQKVAERLGQFAGEGDLVTRIGGDEFGILVASAISRQALGELATDIAMALGEPLRIGMTEVTVGVSIGIAVAPDDGRDAAELVRAADVALYRAKALDGGGFAFAGAGSREAGAAGARKA